MDFFKLNLLFIKVILEKNEVINLLLTYPHMHSFTFYFI